MLHVFSVQLKMGRAKCLSKCVLTQYVEPGDNLMIVKQPDDRSSHIAQLEELLEIVPADKKSTVAAELRALRAGMKGERDSSYLIDFDYGNSNNWVVIHDLRLEMND